METKQHPPHLIFVTTLCSSPWGGSEFLWKDAALRLVTKGCAVSASIQKWSQPSKHLQELARSGVSIHERRLTGPTPAPVWFWRNLRPFLPLLSRIAFKSWLARRPPGLVCISNGDISDGLGFMKLCMRVGRPYTIVVHANAELWWPADSTAKVLSEIYLQARRVFFVSQGNMDLFETQFGIRLPNAEIVRNPCNVSRDAAPPWPGDAVPLRLACVGRLEPIAKGQDLLLRVLAVEPWKSRKIKVSFFGRGDCENGVRRLAEQLGVSDKVDFAGHVDDIKSLWATHHALVLPSRFEGLPLTIVEAMLCGRPVIVTDVAGNAEFVTDGVDGFIAEAPTVKHLSAAMERAWKLRSNWEDLGRAAAANIRQRLPDDPAADFAQRLMDLVEERPVGPANR